MTCYGLRALMLFILFNNKMTHICHFRVISHSVALETRLTALSLAVANLIVSNIHLSNIRGEGGEHSLNVTSPF
jgi:hypothetical protein